MVSAPGAGIVTRFAPSPTGHLHLGHAYSALLAWKTAKAAGGRFLLRIEDIDRARCRSEFEAAIYRDLAWLGIDWELPVRRQSEHEADYRAALERLETMGVLYPCFCSRKDIAAAASAPHQGEAALYPGICRNLDPATAARRKAAGDPFALRLDVGKAMARIGPLVFCDAEPAASSATEIGVLRWHDILAEPERLGDVVLGRRDAPSSYHLAATLDDAIQGVTLVIRGEDLRPATHLHRLLQALLGLATPKYRHHVLLTNESGVRLSKRDGALALRAMREQGRDAGAVRAMAGFPDA
ncbi:MAG TPA: tRNA glutamyl-Q(34) synthetase GluQRS [Candidatus Cybelea sp.]|nr:tRNA glutamyl-Q(34) synthetase GluQRS [Candidatus Cybelea sp.]